MRCVDCPSGLDRAEAGHGAQMRAVDRVGDRIGRAIIGGDPLAIDERVLFEQGLVSDPHGAGVYTGGR